MARQIPDLAVLLFCMAAAGSTAFAQEPTAPPRAREHALAWRANLDSIAELTCEYRMWTAVADSAEDAFAFRLRECTNARCRFAHGFENGSLFMRDGYVKLVVEDEDLGHHVFLRDGYKVRLRCRGRLEDGAYKDAELATPAGSVYWNAWFSSRGVPHRLLLMGDRISTRVDYDILKESPAFDDPDISSQEFRCEEGVDFYGRKCDVVAVIATTPRDRFVYKHYFDAQVPGLLWGEEIVFEDGSRTVSRMLEVRWLTGGQWYPSKAVSISIGSDGSLLSEGHVEAIEVTRLEPKAPPIDEFQVKIRGTVWFMDLGDAGWLYGQEHVVRADQLQDFVEQMKEAALEKQTALAQGGGAQTVPVGAAATTGLAPPGKTSRVRFVTYAIVGTVAVLVAGGLLLWAQRRGRKRAPEH